MRLFVQKLLSSVLFFRLKHDDLDRLEGCPLYEVVAPCAFILLAVILIVLMSA